MLDLLQLTFKPWPREVRSLSPSEFFRWKHAAGPCGPSALFVAEDGDELVGFAAYMPWRFRARGQTLTAMRGVDLAVHPDHRRRGASMAFRAAAERLPGVAFLWSNPNEAARRGGLKAGRRQVGHVAAFLRPCGSPAQALRRRWARGAHTPEQLTVAGEDASEALGDQEYLARLLASSEPVGERLSTVKDPAYLRWRYGRLREYSAVREDHRGSGLAIFRPRRRGRLWVLDVCELFAERGDRRTTRALLRRVGAAASADFISCAFRSAREAASYGFAPSPRGAALTVQVHPLREDLTPDPTRRESWALSRGDLELL